MRERERRGEGGGREREREREGESLFFLSSQNGKDYTSKPEQLLCSSFAIPLGSDSSMKKVINENSYHYNINLLSPSTSLSLFPSL